MRAFLVRACARCPVPNIDQEQGTLPAPKDRHVTATLRATRRGIDPFNDQEKPEEFFGQNVTHVYRPGQTLKVGDPVTVLERSPKPNFKPL